MHADALLDILTADSAGIPTDRAISYLEMINRMEPPSSDVLVDLSAARLARAARMKSAREALAGLDAASRAAALDPHSPGARFNRALAMESIGLSTTAAQAWREYLTLDSTTRWADEAKREISRLSPETSEPPNSSHINQQNDTRAILAGRSPEQALTFAWDTLLARWARSIEKNDRKSAALALHDAETVATAVARNAPDSLTIDAVAAIRAATRDGRATRGLASAIASLADGDLAFRSNRYREADTALSYAAQLQAGSHGAIRAWTEFAYDNNLLSLGRSAEAEQRLVALSDAPDARRYPAVAGRIDWTLGVIRLRRGDAASGIASLRRARAAFDRLDQQENAAAMIGIEAESRLEAGDRDAGITGLVQALAMLRPFPTSIGRHNALTLLMNAAASEGLRYAAMAIDDEDAFSLERRGTTISRAGALIGRMNRLVSDRRFELARTVDHSADAAIAAVPDSASRLRLTQRLAVARAAMFVDSEPPRALASLNAAIATFESSNEVALLLPALLLRARAAANLGATDSSVRDLTRALDLLERTKRQFSTESASLRSTAHLVVDSLIVARVRVGDARGALDILDRWHSAFASGSVIRARSVPATRPVLAEDLIGDTLYAWVKHEGSIRLTRTFVEPRVLATAVERTRLLLEQGAPEQAWRPSLARLYDWLIRPVKDDLGERGETLRIVPADAAADVPYAALFDGHHYLVERHAIVVADGMTPAKHATHRSAIGMHPVVVGNPAQTGFPTLPPIAFADSEAAWITARYPHAALLRGLDADSAAITQALPSATLFHFAGHAVYDEARPERSAHAVGAHGLTAAAISTMDLSRMSLAILSACDVMRGSERPEGASNGLTDAFLAAGVRGVIGTVWRIDDAASESVVRKFYLLYDKSGDAANALRRAQLSFIGESPSTWAAFRYAER